MFAFADGAPRPPEANFRSHPGDPELQGAKPRQLALQPPVGRQREHSRLGLGGSGTKREFNKVKSHEES